MRARSFIYLFIGLALLVLASHEFLNSTYLIWRTVAPVPTGYRGHTRSPTPEEASAFGERAKTKLRYTVLSLVVSVGPFWVFGRECLRAYRRRRAVEQAVAADDPAAGKSV
jgi:hypothetical protein